MDAGWDSDGFGVESEAGVAFLAGHALLYLRVLTSGCPQRIVFRCGSRHCVIGHSPLRTIDASVKRWRTFPHSETIFGLCKPGDRSERPHGLAA